MGAVDPDGNLTDCSRQSTGGTYNPGVGQICFTTPSQERTYSFILTGTDACGAVKTDSVCVEIEVDECLSA